MPRNFACTDFTRDAEFWEKKLNDGKITYMIIGEEKCPDTSRDHWQIYFVTKSDHKFTPAFCKKFEGRHIEVCVRTQEENIKYCSKGGVFQELGTRPRQNQGKRNDLVEIKKKIDAGATRLEIAEQYFNKFCQYSKPFDAYRQLRSPPRNFQTKVIVVWGVTGSGKTTLAVRRGASPVFYDGSFFHGYSGEEEVVLFDEFDYTKMPRNLLLQLLDRHPCKVNVKNGTVNWRPREVIFTSNFDPSFWYPDPDTNEQDTAVRRRFSDPIGRIIHLTEPMIYSGVKEDPVLIDCDDADVKVKMEPEEPAVAQQQQEPPAEPALEPASFGKTITLQSIKKDAGATPKKKRERKQEAKAPDRKRKRDVQLKRAKPKRLRFTKDSQEESDTDVLEDSDMELYDEDEDDEDEGEDIEFSEEEGDEDEETEEEEE